jgi:hypothetical protein
MTGYTFIFVFSLLMPKRIKIEKRTLQIVEILFICGSLDDAREMTIVGLRLIGFIMENRLIHKI